MPMEYVRTRFSKPRARHSPRMNRSITVPAGTKTATGYRIKYRMLDQIVERRILEAQAQGDFDGLPGTGAPLELDDDRLVPQEVRVAHRVLRNAGLVPPEVEQLHARHDHRKPVSLLTRMESVLEQHGRPRGTLSRDRQYAGRILARLNRPR